MMGGTQAGIGGYTKSCGGEGEKEGTENLDI